MTRHLLTIVACMITLTVNQSSGANTPYWWGQYKVLAGDQSPGSATASIAHLKHLVAKTDSYFKASYPSGSGRIAAIMKEPWYTDSSNNNQALKVGLLRDVSEVIYDKIAAESPPQVLKNGLDRALHTKWIVDASPFYQEKQLRVGAKITKPIASGGVIYPWSPSFAKTSKNTKVTINRLKFTFSFELPSTRDRSVWVSHIPEGKPYNEYKLYTPANLGTGKLPLVVDLTGDGGYSGDSSLFSRYGHYRSYVLAFKNANNPLLDSIIEKIEEVIANGSVDPKRVYVKSYSRGGVLLMELLHKRPDLITVAWFVDPGISSLGLGDNPFRNREWDPLRPTRQQISFAKRLKSSQVNIILSPCQNTGNSAIWTAAEMLKFYQLFSNYGVNVKYSMLRGNHGFCNGDAIYDFRYWNYMFLHTKP